VGARFLHLAFEEVRFAPLLPGSYATDYSSAEGCGCELVLFTVYVQLLCPRCLAFITMNACSYGY